MHVYIARYLQSVILFTPKSTATSVHLNPMERQRATPADLDLCIGFHIPTNVDISIIYSQTVQSVLLHILVVQN